MNVNFKLEIFEGPLDLLLNLIDKNKINIYDIPIELILNQYMEYIDELQRLDMEITGEFINMAAELILIKSKMLLPRPEKDDPRSKLTATLIEYKLIKEAALYLGEKYSIYGGRSIREPAIITKETILELHDVELLRTALNNLKKIIETEQKHVEDHIASINEQMAKPVIYVREKILTIIRLLRSGDKINFSDIFEKFNNKSEIIAAFIAVLKLVGSGRVIVIDENHIMLNNDWKNNG
ncbi:MAG: segregation/condensation protein A [Oscillospiraceae bacterium]|nr:segregation/condensation protein A [Oscillospiraceae bacterium]